MKKKYYVNVHYDVVLKAEVIAKNEDDALKLAEKLTEEISLEDGEVVDVKSCVTWIDKIE